MIDLVCLGVGKGSSHALRGMPSTAFALRVDGRPELLIDCGAGVGLSYRRHLGESFPRRVYISHNHADHAADLPPVVGRILPRQPVVLCHGEVCEILREHRFHDAPAAQRAAVEAIVWAEPDGAGKIDLPDGLSLHLFRSAHSYACYGFMLRRGGLDLLGYPADCGFDEAIFRRATRAPIAVLDGRDDGNADHASLRQIDEFAREVPGCAIRVVHYEQTSYRFTAPNVRLLAEGEVVALAP